jgi:arginase family enzyme
MYVHLDLDVLDPEVAAANKLSVRGGSRSKTLNSLYR